MQYLRPCTPTVSCWVTPCCIHQQKPYSKGDVRIIKRELSNKDDFFHKLINATKTGLAQRRSCQPIQNCTFIKIFHYTDKNNKQTIRWCTYC